MPDVHPDHAALIAELRDFNDFLSDGTGEHPAPDRLLEAIVEDVAKALASAPSPRTPLPQEATFEMAQAATQAWHESPYGDDWSIAKRKDREQWMKGFIDRALAAAPKVEQRTPTRESLALAFFHRDAPTHITDWESLGTKGQERYFCLGDAALALFTSPEAPESETR